ANTTLSKVRARVEHVFGQQQNSMGGKIVRTIGIVRARFKIGMMNLGYNIRRLVQLERMAAAPTSARSREDSVWHRANERAAPGQASKRSPIGDPPHLGTSAVTARSAKAEIAESEYCSRFPKMIDEIKICSKCGATFSGLPPQWRPRCDHHPTAMPCA